MSNEKNPVNDNGDPQYLILDMTMVRTSRKAKRAFEILCYEDAVLTEEETNLLLKDL